MRSLSPSDQNDISRTRCYCSPYAVLILDVPSNLSFTSILKKLTTTGISTKIIRADSINRNIVLQALVEDLLDLLRFVREYKLTGHIEFKMMCMMKSRDERVLLRLIGELAEDQSSKSIRKSGKTTRCHFIMDDVLGSIDYKQRNRQIHLRFSFLDIIGVKKDAIKLRLLFREELPSSLFFVPLLDDALLASKILPRIASISSLVEKVIC